MTLSSWQSSSR